MYDYELVLTRDANTAGKGVLDFYLGGSLQAGGQMQLAGRMFIATQLPDTVDLGAGRAFLAGGSVTTKCYFGGWGWRQDR